MEDKQSEATVNTGIWFVERRTAKHVCPCLQYSTVKRQIKTRPFNYETLWNPMFNTRQMDVSHACACVSQA
jgi:hypothetical protein